MKKWLQGLKCAIKGIKESIISQLNMKIHIIIMLLVIIAGIFFQISQTEWFICIILFGLVIGMEVMNTAVEAVVDRVTMEKDDMARRAKDAAAGAVLVVAIASAVIGLWIFVPKLFC